MAVTVRTPARLHLGLLDMNGGLGRLYGSIGVAIEGPSVVLEADLQNAGEASELVVEGLEQERVTTYAGHFLERYSLPGKVHLNLRSSIPAHVGLGSGTQLALAVGAALTQLGGLKLSATELGLTMKRGARSLKVTGSPRAADRSILAASRLSASTASTTSWWASWGSSGTSAHSRIPRTRGSASS